MPRLSNAQNARATAAQCQASSEAATADHNLDKILSTFPSHYDPVTSATVSEDEYCLHLAAAHNWQSIAAVVSDGTLAVYNRDTLEPLVNLAPHQGNVTGLKYSPKDCHILWTSGEDGLVKMWDIRTSQCEKQFRSKKRESTATRPLTCMDVSSNERILCGGTELTVDGAFILFWDVRGDKLLGSYSQSHTDDITQVRFSPVSPDTLATSATDCLINVFDISQKREEDAFTYCLNTESVVDKLFWLSHSKDREMLAGLTDIETLQYWDIKEAAPLQKLTRQDIATVMKHEQADDCYFVSVDRTGEGTLSILAGFRSESSENPLLSGNSNDFLCSLKFDPSNGRLTPLGAFLPKQKLLTTRASLYDSSSDTYITVGECGILRLWRSRTSGAGGKQPNEKSKKKKKHRNKPY